MYLHWFSAVLCIERAFIWCLTFLSIKTVGTYKTAHSVELDWLFLFKNKENTTKIRPIRALFFALVVESVSDPQNIVSIQRSFWIFLWDVYIKLFLDYSIPLFKVPVMNNAIGCALENTLSRTYYKANCIMWWTLKSALSLTKCPLMMIARFYWNCRVCFYLYYTALYSLAFCVFCIQPKSSLVLPPGAIMTLTTQVWSLAAKASLTAFANSTLFFTNHPLPPHASEIRS